jgi:hypothetical protein
MTISRSRYDRRGDSSCADHNIAWKTRHGPLLDYVPAGVSGDATRPDNIVYDIIPQTGQMPGDSASGWGHPVLQRGGDNDRGRAARGQPLSVLEGDARRNAGEFM